MNNKQYQEFLNSIKDLSINQEFSIEEFQAKIEEEIKEAFPNPLYYNDTEMVMEDFDTLQAIFPEEGYSKIITLGNYYEAFITFYSYQERRIIYISVHEGDNTAYGFIIDSMDIEFWQSEFPHSLLTNTIPVAWLNNCYNW